MNTKDLLKGFVIKTNKLKHIYIILSIICSFQIGLTQTINEEHKKTNQMKKKISGIKDRLLPGWGYRKSKRLV